MDKVKLNSQLIVSLADALYVSPSVIYSASGIANSTWYRIMQQPEILTIQQLLGIANGMHIPVKRFFYTGNMLIVGHRDDYITESYTPCRYDADALAEFVATTDSATWLQAAKEIGVGRDNLRHSLLGERRTPVIRFLEVCNVFGINPFRFLIDPNPEVEIGSGRRNKPAAPTELKALREDMLKLSKTVAQLTEQYKHLLAQHEALLREFRAYRGDNNTHMAAEDIPEPKPDED
jgi:hypothetical protein